MASASAADAARWDGVIVDGHNRYAICRKHDLPYQTATKDFGTREEAKADLDARVGEEQKRIDSRKRNDRGR